MKNTSLIVFLFLPFFLFSQDKNQLKVIDFSSGNYPIGEKVKILYNKNWRSVTEIDSADYYRVVNFKEKNIPSSRVVGFYITGEKQSSFYASYIGLDSKGIDSLYQNGPSVYYHKNGNKSSITNFFNNKKDGSEILILGTAHPYKFLETIKMATSQEVETPKQIEHLMNKKENYDILENKIDNVKKYILGKIS